MHEGDDRHLDAPSGEPEGNERPATVIPFRKPRPSPRADPDGEPPQAA